MAHSGGRRLFKNADVKIKGINLLPPIVNGITGSWALLWGAGWNDALIAGWVKQCALLGANCIKITGGTQAESTSAVYPVESTYRQRRYRLFQLCRQYGLGVYWNFANGPNAVSGPAGGQAATIVPTLVALAQTIAIDGADVVVGFDLCNEYNINFVSNNFWASGTNVYNSACAADMNLFVKAMRAANLNIPMSASLSITAASQLTSGNNSFLDLHYDLGLDFHDIHLYYQDGNFLPSGGYPAAADMAGLESRAKYCGRHFVGEMGCCFVNQQSGQPSNNTANQLRYFNAMGDIAARPQSHGVVMFGLTDFESVRQYGIYSNTDTTFSTPRTGMTVPFTQWPANA